MASARSLGTGDRTRGATDAGDHHRQPRCQHFGQSVAGAAVELEDVPDGNARSGRNAISACPLGAHYLPIPNAEAHGVRHLLDRLGIITGWQDDRPIFDPYQIVGDPDERLFRHGRRQEGLVPGSALGRGDRDQIAGGSALR